MIPWVMAALAVLGAKRAQDQQNAQYKRNVAEAKLTKYSPWTRMHGQTEHGAPSSLDGALQGGLTGAMMTKGMGNDDKDLGEDMTEEDEDGKETPAYVKGSMRRQNFY